AAALRERRDHNLKTPAGRLRFRIIKLRPGTPAPPDLRPAAMAAAGPPPELDEESASHVGAVARGYVPSLLNAFATACKKTANKTSQHAAPGLYQPDPPLD